MIPAVIVSQYWALALSGGPDDALGHYITWIPTHRLE